jgi:hypothetical protein
MRHVLAIGLALFGTAAIGCIAPPGPVERLTNAAYEMNSATRFGRLDVAIGHVHPAMQDDFMRRHGSWHRELRIVDVELLGLRLITPETAEVQLAISWHRPNETTMQTSMVAQKWTRKDGDWSLAEELRVGGADGLFVELGERHGRQDPPPLGQITSEGWH